MSLPPAEEMIRPVIRTVQETAGLNEKEIGQVVAAKLGLTDADLAPLRPGVKKKQRLFDFRLHNVIGELKTADWLEQDGKTIRLGEHGRLQMKFGLPYSFRCLCSYPPYASDWKLMGFAGFDDDGVTIFNGPPDEPDEPPDIDELTSEEVSELRDVTPPDDRMAREIGIEIIYGAMNLQNAEMAGLRAVVQALIASHPAPTKLYAELTRAADLIRAAPQSDAVTDDERAAALKQVQDAQAFMRNPTRPM